MEPVQRSQGLTTEPPGDAVPPSTRAVWAISFAILISRVLGLLREMVMSRYFGAGLATDAFNVAYRIPNLLRDLFAEGALSAAFVPTFIRCFMREGKEKAWLLANRLFSALLVIVGAITLAILFGAKGFIYILASGFFDNPQKLELTVQMTRILSPFLLCISLASVLMGLLNAFGSFFVPALASSAFNVFCILSGILLSPLMPELGLDPIVSMAIGGLVGGISQFLIMAPSAYATGFRFRFSLDFSDPSLRHLARLMIPAIVGLSATQINIAVDSQLASAFGNGPMSWLNYGFRLMQFPIGIFGIAIATTTMAAISIAAARADREELNRTLASSLRFAACLTFPAMVGLIVFRLEIVRLLYEGGPFLPAHTTETSRVVLLYALGLFSYSAVKILVPAFYVLNDARTPVRASMITIAAKIALNFALIIPLNFLGLALATSLASWINFGILLGRIKTKTGMRWNKADLSGYARIVLASIIMGFLALAVFRIAGLLIIGNGIPAQSARLGLAIVAGVGVHIPLLLAFRIKEGRDIYTMAKNLVGKIL